MHDRPVTVFLNGVSNADDPMHATLGAVVGMLRGEHPDADLAKYCLRAAQHGDDAAYEAAKKRLPIAVFSGHFSYRSNNRCVEYSSLVVIDLDDVEDPDALRAQLGADPHCALAFLSPSGRGVKPVFAVAGDKTQHVKAWATVMAYLKTTYGIDAASSKSQHDLCRACFLGIDTAAIFNENATPLSVRDDIEIPKAEPSAEQHADVAGRIKPNDRHSYLIAYCARLASIGLPEPEILAAANTLIEQRFDLSDGRVFADSEVSDAVRSGLRKFRGEDQVAQMVEGGKAAESIMGKPEEPNPPCPLVVRSHADRYRDCLRPPVQLIGGMMPTQGIGAIIAQPGHGKSMIAAELARCVASGEPFAGKPCQQRKVMYFCTDAPDSTERRFLWMPEAATSNILTVPSASRLPGALPEFLLAVEAHNVGLVILDTWDSTRTHAAGGYAEQDGSTDALMSNLRTLAQKRNLAIVIIHHSTKAAPDAARGTLVFDARCDWMGTVVRDPDANVVKLETTKARDGERGVIGAWTIVAEPHPDAPEAPPIPRLALMTDLEAAAEEGRGMLSRREKRSREIAGILMQNPQASGKEIADRVGCSPSSVSKAMTELRERGWLTENNTITEAGRTALETPQ